MFSFFERPQRAKDLELPKEFVRIAIQIRQILATEHRDQTWSPRHENLNLVSVAEHGAYRFAAGLEGHDRCLMAIALLQNAARTNTSVLDFDAWKVALDLQTFSIQMVGKPGSVSPSQIKFLVSAWMENKVFGDRHKPIVKVIERVAAEHGLTPEVESAIQSLLGEMESSKTIGEFTYGYNSAAVRQLAIRLRTILDPSLADKFDLPEPWQAPFRDPCWESVLKHAATAKTKEMPNRWAKSARPLLEGAGADEYLSTFSICVDALGNMDKGVDALHSDMLRGLAWFAGIEGSDVAAAILGRMLQISAHKLEGIGPRSPKGFGGALQALEKMGSFRALAELSRIRNRVKATKLSADVLQSLERAARKQSMSVEELEELVVPTFGLEHPGVRSELLGSVAARLEIQGTTAVNLRWFRDGKELKAAPAECKSDHSEVVTELRAATKEIETTLAAQRVRIESMLMTERSLKYADWRERYIDHPLLANMTRRLIWQFTKQGIDTLGIWFDGDLIDVEGNPIEGLDEAASVRLWHPIHSEPSIIDRWRRCLLSSEISQPFKQAHREIYVVTAAEERTASYSNRFAAHILKQHQLNALARSRGWRYRLQGNFDGHNNLVLDLAQFGIRCEYWVEATDLGGRPDAEVMSELGIALYVSTDRVVFCDAGLPIPLASVRPVLFSEVMRDIDLFVGVASVGNDPAWMDQGPDGYLPYWSSVSFGDLTISAETRKAVVERLLPRFSFGSVAKIDGNFLVVKGKRRTYKIHLGSGNILMMPNDQYLCIVQGQFKSSAETYYLPFEGDRVLSLIISKAMMLADDDKIKDRTILAQLNR